MLILACICPRCGYRETSGCLSGKEKTWHESQLSNDKRDSGNSLATSRTLSPSCRHTQYKQMVPRVPSGLSTSHQSRQAGLMSSQQVSKFPGSEEGICSSEAPFPGIWEAGPLCSASNRSWAADRAIWRWAIWALHLNVSWPKGHTFLEHVLLRPQHPRSTKGKMSPKPGRGCLFMQSLNNSSLSLLSSSQRVTNKCVALAYCLQLRIVEREENITETEGDTRRSVTFNCTTYNQSHQIKALYIFLNNL